MGLAIYLSNRKKPAAINSNLFILCIYVFCLHVCLCTTYVPDAQRGQKTESDPLELELKMAVKAQYHVLVCA